MRRRTVFTAALLALAGPGGAQPVKKTGRARPAVDDAFVRVAGAGFVRHGRPYYVAGANLWYGGHLGVANGLARRQRLVKELDALHALGINSVRVLAVSEQSAMKSALSPATTRAPGVYDEALLQGLDFLLVELRKRGMTAVLYLNNFWQWSGGMTQYLNWFTGSPAHDPKVSKDVERFMAENARFYTIEEAQQEYRRVIARLVNRVNSIDRLPYRDDPTIMSWQLANQPRPGNSKAGRQ